MSQQPGFVSRQTAAGPDGSRLVLVWWTDAASADASMASFAKAPATAAFMALVAADTMVLYRYDVDG